MGDSRHLIPNPNRKETMKPSHIQTPRTLAECTWTTGYSSVRPERKTHWLEVVACVAIFAGIGVLLAWRG